MAGNSLSRPEHGRDTTEQDVLAALVSLGSLPRRPSAHAEMDLAAYRVALDGVKVSTLVEAVRRILRGTLGHAFLPSPPEFRLTCDRIDGDARTAEAERSRRQRLIDEAAAFRPMQHSEASRARIAELHRQFCQAHAAHRLAEMDTAGRAPARR